MEESKKGGKRVNSGRKPLSDPKKPITLYVPKSKILLNGGDEKLRLRIYDVIAKDFILVQKQDSISANVTGPYTPAIETRKTIPDWIAEKREILIPELYQDFIDRLNKAKYLTEKERKDIKFA